MDIRLSALLYSEYSLQCSRFLSLLDGASVDVMSAVNLRLLNIDNKKIRQQILGSPVIDVKVVPCVLIVHVDGVVEKYEGRDAFEWLEHLIAALTPPPPPPPPTPTTQETVTDRQQSEPTLAKPSEDIPSATSIDDLGEEPPEILPIQRPKASVLTGSGAYEFQEFGEVDDINRSTTKGISSSKGGKKDVVSVAQAMQKARESEFEKLKPPGMP